MMGPKEVTAAPAEQRRVNLVHIQVRISGQELLALVQ